MFKVKSNILIQQRYLSFKKCNFYAPWKMQLCNPMHEEFKTNLINHNQIFLANPNRVINN